MQVQFKENEMISGAAETDMEQHSEGNVHVTEFTYLNDWKTEINNVPNNNEDITRRNQRIISSWRYLGCLLGYCLPE